MAPWIGAAIGGVASLLGGRSQSRAADKQGQIQKQVFKRQRKDLAPWRESGRTANNALAFEMGLGDQPEGYGGFQMSPYQQFRMDQGRQQVEASAAARGNRFSGATMNAVNDRGQMMSNAFEGEYLDRLGGMSTTGQNAAAQTGAFGGQYAQGMAGVNSGIGNAQAGGFMGVSNAINSGINNTWAMNAYDQHMANNPNNNSQPSSAIPWLSRMMQN